jgi:predicted transcriptional regulator
MKKDFNNFQILKAIEADSSVSQRMLSSQMRLNVASVNFAMKGLINKGYITKVGENLRRTKYYITSEGIREKITLAYKSFGRNMQYFNEIRRDIESQILKATDGRETSVAIYGVSELSDIVYMVVSTMGWDFLGFFLEDSEITKDKVFDYSVQKTQQLRNDNQYLLLLMEELSPAIKNSMEIKKAKILDLVGYNIS